MVKNMNINFIPLNTKGRVDFNEPLELKEVDNPMIKEFIGMNCAGTIVDNGTEEYEINLHITGTVVLKSSINGSDVRRNIDIECEDLIPNLVENFKNSSNTLDILPIIWENILLEIPISVKNADDEFEMSSGNGWEILDEE